MLSKVSIDSNVISGLSANLVSETTDAQTAEGHCNLQIHGMIKRLSYMSLLSCLCSNYADQSKSSQIVADKSVLFSPTSPVH